jgi:hypothetical protein
MQLNTVCSEIKSLWLPNHYDRIRNYGENVGEFLDVYSKRAKLRAEIYHENRDQLTKALNSNALDSDLQRPVILQESIRDLAIVLAPLSRFCTKFENVPLAGQDKVSVKYYPLVGSGVSQDFNPSTGYATFANSTTNAKQVLIGGATPAQEGSNAATGTACARKYIGLQFDSLTLRRQPGFDSLALSRLQFQRLGVDVFTDVVSRVITQANFGPATKSVTGGAFTGQDVGDLQHQCNLAQMPLGGRSLVLDSALHNNALNDVAYRTAVTNPNRAGITNSYGFENNDVVVNLSSYGPAGANLAGWAAWKSAVLFATAPIAPTPEVRKIMTAYELVTDEMTGLTIEFRASGNATLDTSALIVQICYGAVVGVASALKWIASSN